MATSESDGSEIHVCQAGSCRRAGSEALLLEIEELTAAFDCTVKPSGCVGACSRAPNAVSVTLDPGDGRAREKLHTQLSSVEKSAAMVAIVTGVEPDLSDPALVRRLEASRKLRARQRAEDENKWNGALVGLSDQVAAELEQDARAELQFKQAALETSAGRWEAAVTLLEAVYAHVGAHPTVVENLVNVLARLGRTDALEQLEARLPASWSSIGRWREAQCAQAVRQARALAAKHLDAEALRRANGVPRPVEGYAVWTLVAKEVVSLHSAIFRFTCTDKCRGTPYTRGKGRTIWHKTWHTTLLAAVGPNTEGPLPWVERDYTPISGWAEWERGECAILIKVYTGGAATQWLAAQPLGTKVLLSQPRRTLYVPSLRHTVDSPTHMHHDAVLLVVGGTGVVAVPQVLAHANPATCFSTAAPAQRRAPLRSPVALLYACRADDVLLLPELGRWVTAPFGEQKLERVALAVSTETAADCIMLPFPDAMEAKDGRTENDAQAALEAFTALPNVAVAEGRVSLLLLKQELEPLRRHGTGVVRVVVSGPESFNAAIKQMLLDCEVPADAVTVLSA